MRLRFAEWGGKTRRRRRQRRLMHKPENEIQGAGLKAKRKTGNKMKMKMKMKLCRAALHRCQPTEATGIIEIYRKLQTRRSSQGAAITKDRVAIRNCSVAGQAKKHASLVLLLKALPGACSLRRALIF